MKYIYSILLLSLFVTTYKVKAQCAGNYLLNPSFETPIQTGNTNGNNLTGLFSWGNWAMTGGPFNVIRVNGTGYPGGPNNAQQGIQYIDVTSASGTVTQTFNLGCTANISFSGWFSSREASGYADWTASIEIVNAANTVVAVSATRNFTVADADNNPGDAIWYQLSGSATNLPSGTYTFRVNLGNYGNFDNAFLCASPGCLLPAKLISFGGENTSPGNLLKWKIADQIDLAKFVVERSIDGITFNTIETIAVTSSSQVDFEFIDRILPIAKSWFYRLKMTDNDGSFRYSTIIKIDGNSPQQTTMTVYPNPAAGKLVNLFIETDKRQPSANIELMDLTGKIVVYKKIQLEKGINSLILSYPSIASGMYLLKLVLPDKSLISKINIQ